MSDDRSVIEQLGEALDLAIEQGWVERVSGQPGAPDEVLRMTRKGEAALAALRICDRKENAAPRPPKKRISVGAFKRMIVEVYVREGFLPSDVFFCLDNEWFDSDRGCCLLAYRDNDQYERIADACDEIAALFEPAS